MSSILSSRRAYLAASAVSLGVPAVLLLLSGIVGLAISHKANEYAVSSIALAFGIALGGTAVIEFVLPSRWSFPALVGVTLLLATTGLVAIAGGGFFILLFALPAWAGLMLDAAARGRRVTWIAALPIVVFVAVYAAGQVWGLLW